MLSRLHVGLLLHGGLVVGQAGWKMLAVFVGRHWLFALANAALTVLFGLLVLRIASWLWPLRSRPTLLLKLRRLIYLVALLKGAFDLVVGDSLVLYRGPIGIGWQLPPPTFLDYHNWPAHFDIWHPTPDTHWVTPLLCGLALVLFLSRAYRVGIASNVLVALDRICPTSDPRVDASLQHAAQALKIRSTVKLPKVLLVEVKCATPLLIGVFQPRLLLSPRLVAMLTDDELEMALRHELAHLKRRDHWWRWIQLCIEDICRPILIGGRLGSYSVETEELLCDRAAVASPKDASCLANAIAKAASLLRAPDPPPDSGGPPIHPIVGLEESVVPSLLGKRQSTLGETASLNRRIQELLALSLQLAEKGSPRSKWPILAVSSSIIGFPIVLILSILLFAVLFGRFHFLLFHIH